MKQVKGFRMVRLTPEPSGPEWEGYIDGQWKLYQRGPRYRVGKPSRLWGIRWLRKRGSRGGLFKFETYSLEDAENTLKEKNKEERDQQWYKVSKWEVKK